MNFVLLRNDVMDAALALRNIHKSGSSNRTPLYKGYVYFSPLIGDFLVFFPHTDPEPHRRTLHIYQLLTCLSEPGRACCGDNSAFGVGGWRARCRKRTSSNDRYPMLPCLVTQHAPTHIPGNSGMFRYDYSLLLSCLQAFSYQLLELIHLPVYLHCILVAVSLSHDIAGFHVVIWSCEDILCLVVFNYHHQAKTVRQACT